MIIPSYAPAKVDVKSDFSCSVEGMICDDSVGVCVICDSDAMATINTFKQAHLNIFSHAQNKPKSLKNRYIMAQI